MFPNIVSNPMGTLTFNIVTMTLRKTPNSSTSKTWAPSSLLRVATTMVTTLGGIPRMVTTLDVNYVKNFKTSFWHVAFVKF